MKVLLKIAANGKTRAYRPASIDWLFTSYEAAINALTPVVDNVNESIKADADGFKSIYFVGIEVVSDKNYISDISNIGIEEGGVIYILNPETGQTIDIIRYEDL